MLKILSNSRGVMDARKGKWHLGATISAVECRDYDGGGLWHRILMELPHQTAQQLTRHWSPVV